MTLLAVSVIGTIGMLVLGQVGPALAQTPPVATNLEKRNYDFLNDQHLTARFGNDKVCGDHLCAPGEWAKLQENINQAQISHPSNATGHIQMPPTQIPKMPVNTTSTPPTNTTSPAPIPVSTPPPQTVPSHVCTAVKVALGNSTAPDVVAKVLADLGCS